MPLTTTSGAYNFGITTDTDSVIQEAFDRCGKEPSQVSAYDIQSAIRSLNFMAADWSNRQLNLWTVDLQVLPLEIDRKMYTLSNDTVSMLQTAVRIPQWGRFRPADMSMVVKWCAGHGADLYDLLDSISLKPRNKK